MPARWGAAWQKVPAAAADGVLGLRSFRRHLKHPHSTFHVKCTAQLIYTQCTAEHEQLVSLSGPVYVDAHACGTMQLRLAHYHSAIDTAAPATCCCLMQRSQ